ncbi:MAG: class I SAM-dependent methyltransferase [Thermoleophilia bacterium]
MTENSNLWTKKHTIQNNLEIWDEHYAWPQDGDEWSGQANRCNQPYEKWKQSIVDSFIRPNISESSAVLEIAPGHGRWSEEIIRLSRQATLVDLSPACIEFCRQRFSAFDNVSYLANDGRSLAGVADNSVDFIWSFDAFIHMNADVIDSYFSEARRVLKADGITFIHHAGRNNRFLPFSFLRSLGRPGRKLYKLMTMGKLRDDDGWRSDISRQKIVKLARKNGMAVQDQIRSWGASGEYSFEKYGDYISILRRTGS